MKTISENQVQIKLMPGTLNWLLDQENPDGIILAALIEYRAKKEAEHETDGGKDQEA